MFRLAGCARGIGQPHLTAGFLEKLQSGPGRAGSLDDCLSEAGVGCKRTRLFYVIAHQHDVARINVRLFRPQTPCWDIFHRLGFRQEFILPDHVRDLEGDLQDLIIMGCDLAVLCDGVDLAPAK